MSTSIEVKLRNAASVDPVLPTLLGSSPFRFFNTQLPEGSAYPAITVRRISGIPLYQNVSRNAMALYRVQFTVWEGQSPDLNDTVLAALRAFLDTFSATTTAIPSNQIANGGVRGLYAATQPVIYQTLVDVMIWNNDQT